MIREIEIFAKGGPITLLPSDISLRHGGFGLLPPRRIMPRRRRGSGGRRQRGREMDELRPKSSKHPDLLHGGAILGCGDRPMALVDDEAIEILLRHQPLDVLKEGFDRRGLHADDDQWRLTRLVEDPFEEGDAQGADPANQIEAEAEERDHQHRDAGVRQRTRQQEQQTLACTGRQDDDDLFRAAHDGHHRALLLGARSRSVAATSAGL